MNRFNPTTSLVVFQVNSFEFNKRALPGKAPIGGPLASPSHYQCPAFEVFSVEPLAYGLDGLFASRVGGTDVDQHHLILPMINDRAKVRDQHYTLGRRQVAAKNRVLQRLAIAKHRLVNQTQPLRITDVVTDYVPGFHRFNREKS